MSFFRISGSGFPFLQSLAITNRVKCPLASMAAGRVISQNVPLPPEGCVDYAAYFMNCNAGLIAEYLDAMVSVVPLDFKAIQSYALKFYMIRCQAALGDASIACTGHNGVYNLFHIGTQLSEDEIGRIKKESVIFAGFICSFDCIYQDLKRAYSSKQGT